MKTAIMTDSTAYIPEAIRKEHHIHMVPLSVVFDDETYAEEIDITAGEFYDKMRHMDTLPKTTQPSIGYVTEKIEKLAEDYDALISVHLSSGISGTFATVKSAGEMVEGIDVYPYDSELSCMAQGSYTLEAAALAEDGWHPADIMERLDTMKQSMRAYFMVDDLTNLHKGGRLNSAQAFVGGMLKVKPILHFVDKVIVPFEKPRTRKRALNRMMGLLEEDLQTGDTYKVIFIHANDEKSALELQQSFQEKHPGHESMVSYFGPVIGTHLGEGAIGLTWYKK